MLVSFKNMEALSQNSKEIYGFNKNCLYYACSCVLSGNPYQWNP